MVGDAENQVDLAVHINADAAQVWIMLREPSKVAQWHGWQYDELDEEIKQIFFTDVKEDDHHCILTVNGGDKFTLKPVGDGTEVRLERAPRDSGNEWAAYYDDITEGWLTFLQQLRFALERHPQTRRRTTFFSGTASESDQPIAKKLGLAGLPEPGEEYSVTAATGEKLSGKVWFRSEHQLGLTVSHYADHGQGLLIVADTPANEDHPHGGIMVIATTYDVGAKDLRSIRERWDQWRQQNYPESDPVV
ncbi:SRPBCC family protein [Arthrobacter monumenti]